MNKLLIHKIIFGIVMAIYLIVPIVMISRYETVLADGNVFRFRAMPVDPYDSFRGRYVVLRFKEAEVPIESCTDSLLAGDDVYVSLFKNDSGFAIVRNVNKTGSLNDDYFKATVKYVYSDNISLEFPFQRYYMNEELAPLAEKALRNNVWSGSDEVYTDVRIINGTAVIEEIYINGVPLKEYLAALPESKD